MHLIVTRVKLKPGAIEQCIQLFEETNPALVKGEPDWLSARMVVDRENDVVTVMATWTDVSSYQTLAESDRFRKTMSEFAPLFASPPDITINDIVVDMTRESIGAG